MWLSACSLYNATLILYHPRAGMSIIFLGVRRQQVLLFTAIMNSPVE